MFKRYSLVIIFVCSSLHIVSCHPNNNPTALSEKDSTQIVYDLRQSADYLKTDKLKAKSFAEQALALCMNKNNPALEAKCYSAIAASQRYHIDMSKLLNNDTIAIIKAKASKDTTLIYNAIYNYANDLIIFNLLNKADTAVNNCAAIALSSGNDTIISQQLYLEGLYTLKLQSNLSKTEKLFKQSFALAQQQRNYSLAANNRLYIFLTHMYRGEFDSTIQLAFNALDYSEKNNNKQAIANCEFAIGDSYKNQGNSRQAINHLQKAYPIAVVAKDFTTAIKIQTSLNYTYFLINNLDSVATTLPLLKKYADTLGSPFFTAMVKSYTARYSSWTGKYDTALTLLHEAQKLASAINAYKLLGMIYTIEAELYAKQNQVKESDSMQLKAYAAIQKGVSKELLQNMYKTDTHTSGKNLSADYEIEKRLYTDSTFLASKGQDALRVLRHGADTIDIRPIVSAFDSSISVVYNDQLVDYETQYKTKQKEDSLKIAKQEAIIANANLHTKNTMIGGFAIITLLLIGAFWQQYKNRQRAERDKAKIQLLQNEIHHRVKNNLAIIKRFVDVAKQSGKESLSLESLQSRITAIELLHKNLYQTDKAGEISLQTYLEQLVAIIGSTFNEEDKHIEIHVNTPVTTDMQTAEKLGLIVNELVTNSYKYGFRGKTGGEIKITTSLADKDKFTLHVAENGIGYNKEKVARGYGSKLIEGIAQELNAVFNMSTVNGVSFNITV